MTTGLSPSMTWYGAASFFSGSSSRQVIGWVGSGSLDAVKALVEAGAELGTRDKAENATPLGWAEYYQGEKKGDDVKRYAEIAAYLREKEGQR